MKLSAFVFINLKVRSETFARLNVTFQAAIEIGGNLVAEKVKPDITARQIYTLVRIRISTTNICKRRRNKSLEILGTRIVTVFLSYRKVNIRIFGILRRIKSECSRKDINPNSLEISCFHTLNECDQMEGNGSHPVDTELSRINDAEGSYYRYDN